MNTTLGMQRTQRLRQWPQAHPLAFLALAALAWWLAYRSLVPLSEALVALLPVARDSHAGAALQFFFYDVPKVLLLLTGVVFVMGMVNSAFTPERTRALLAGRSEGLANVLAASLGIVTPFCSCSAVPLFIGFVQAGVPLGVTLSFLISAPMVNEVALALLLGLFGWKIALLYLGLGLTVAIVSGWVIGRLKLERWLEDWVRELPRGPGLRLDGEGTVTLADRVAAGFASVREIVGRVWPYILAGIAIGAGIHGWVPQDLMAAIMGRDAWWSVPLAVLIGVPMYTNAAGVIPIVQALLAKGAALGTVLAFMMSVIALSLPEAIILRKVLKLPLIATFMGVVALGILLVGYVFNAVI
ncbi:MAG TPA: permease [Burkholderiaceae bacterium]|nr:permease [Burkholderiaceae bacterium]HNB46890.1 permease [Burkholderiaceae bacterium]HNG78678.1 permease [Burkholderiaceae bacterium]